MSASTVSDIDAIAIEAMKEAFDAWAKKAAGHRGAPELEECPDDPSTPVQFGIWWTSDYKGPDNIRDEFIHILPNLATAKAAIDAVMEHSKATGIAPVRRRKRKSGQGLIARHVRLTKGTVETYDNESPLDIAEIEHLEAGATDILIPTKPRKQHDGVAFE
ncbi:hypothetical protein [Roseibium sp. RKSG952]|uniref:hypothetical protein n=1 Tax=Roseibium sp. RKSG952 TaxID=2529384 RepID=UPI0012BBD418|nr:hypothetical protein [Roseibium sp. RKSG952]MTH94946.1 hypothetical protein [Roseibium sp. RKSG952]